MCRIAGFSGRALPLASLLYDAPHSLERQAYAPREMINGTVNVDGTGIAWWTEAAVSEPLVYVSERPPWADPNLPRLSRHLAGGMQVASVRSATPGIPIGPSNVHPFTRGPLAFVHNGFLGAFRDGHYRPMLAALDDELHREYGAVSDSLLLFLTMCRHLEGDARGDLATALRLALGEAMAIAQERGTEVVLNTIVGDGEQLVAARAAHNAPSNTLYVRVDPEVGVSIASEPLDEDERWRAVDDSTLGIVRNGEWAPTALDTPQPS